MKMMTEMQFVTRAPAPYLDAANAGTPREFVIPANAGNESHWVADRTRDASGFGMTASPQATVIASECEAMSSLRKRQITDCLVAPSASRGDGNRNAYRRDAYRLRFSGAPPNTN